LSDCILPSMPKIKINSEYASKLKNIIGLRGEPVAVKLVAEGATYPAGYDAPETQISHCQAVTRARKGQAIKLSAEDQSCHVGSAVLGMAEAPEKILSGEFHAGIGIHDSAAAAKNMIAQRKVIPKKIKGEIVCPLKDADFDPDAVIFIDVPERIYWIMAASTAADGSRAEFSTAPFQCACEDITAMPIINGRPNISIGCFGCRKKTDMRPDEMAIGIPYSMIQGIVEHIEKYESGVMAKSKRD
jgi:uncharacterized protein (DUF169 family)